MNEVEPREGIFISRRALLALGSVGTGLFVAGLVLAFPRLGVPIGAGLAAAGLVLTALMSLWQKSAR
ncbi:hypothetical protein E1264_09815 [Actinomadura sp. KC216]|uniref:hypothetical protein n=1 Tax=Actinomadura sp. KC216 TaxID=2530370 RepID=UPI0010537A62|nr:hypothetical protein [Actinomadura sp. KC216]TDB88975.1 hypothetical protein E1264_09815 [Actinomadura sp. KC216]